MPGSGHITQPGPQPDPPSGRSGAHHGWKVRVHKSRAAQSIKSARSDNFMGKMDSRQVRGCRRGGWMPAEGRAELWSLRDSPALPDRTVPRRPSDPAGWAPAPLPAPGDAREQEEALPRCSREQGTGVAPGAGTMIGEPERGVPARSLTFTNHRVWRGGKDWSRLAAGLGCAAGTAQQVPLCPQPPSRSSTAPSPAQPGQEPSPSSPMHKDAPARQD